ncbi:CRISPR-associated protein Cas1 [Streptococcus sp. HSISB1]|nr:CRISPR-associated protein Cas1 [Streptococcus sp. HSISB1]
MTWRVVHVNQSEKMHLKLDNIVIKKQGEEYTIPLSDISIIVVEGGDNDKRKLKNDTGNILLVFKNMDDYLDYSSFIRICESITQITSEFPNFYCTIFPSNESYLYVTKETI